MTKSIISANELLPPTNKLRIEVEKKIKSLMADALPYYSSIFRNLFLENIENANIICDFIVKEINNQNIKTSTKITHLKILCWFNKYLNYKNFDLVTRDDVSDYLNSLRKEESIDPTHKWIGTYNTSICLFFSEFYHAAFKIN